MQYQSFRRNQAGLTCLHRWRDQYLEWCYDRAEEGKYGDQKYLDEWPTLYGDQLVKLQHKGGGVAPWNWSSNPIIMGKEEILVGNDPLIFYHFHGVKIHSPYFISNGLLDWGMTPWSLLRWFYAGYHRQLQKSRRWLKSRLGINLPMHDQTMRGKGISITSLREILRKAWAQATIVF